MARSLSLAAYLAFARRQPASLPRITTPRTDGELVWMHCADPARARAMAQLGLRLAANRPGTSLLLTTSPGQKPPKPLPEGVIWQEGPSETPGDIRIFLNHWRPDLLLWLGPWLRPALIDATAQRNIPAVLLEADTPGLENRRWRWMPEPTRATLMRFSALMVFDDSAAERFRKSLPLDGPTIILSGALLEESPALTYNETDLEELRTVLTGRPVWLAARLQPEETPAVLSAYRKVLKLSHRMLLILAADTPKAAVAIRRQLVESGLHMADWEDGEFPDTKTHVLFAETPDELGLWFRVAPVTLMGSSMIPGFGGRDPLEPAALGSAVLYGPGVRDHLDAYSRLVDAGGARIAKDASSLAAAVIHLLAPDQVATMAHAGWRVVSDGAEVSDAIITLSQDMLDAKDSYS